MRSVLLVFVFLGVISVLSAQTVLTGQVSDENNETLIGATVKVLKGTEVVRGAITDFEGNFRIAIDPGSYNVEFSYTGYQTARVEGVRVLVGQLNMLNGQMSSNTVLQTVQVTSYKVALVEVDKTTGGQTLTSDQIKNLPTRSVNAIVATTAGTTSVDGGDVSIKGSRANGTNYYIDGIRVYGNQVPPVQDIEQLQVITGGLGAEYGDVTGGVISVVTKGPASEYNGAIEVENSHGLDAFGWLLGTANISGPLLKRKNANGSKTTLVGFRLSGQYLSQKDDDPTAIPVFRAKDDVLARLQKSPLVRLAGSLNPRAELLTQDSVQGYNYNPFENRRDIDLTSKLDFRLSDNMDFSLTGTFKDTEDRFTPLGVNGTGTTWADENRLLLNSQDNPTRYTNRYRAIARFRHRLGNSDGRADNSKKVTISNASYQLQGGFERFTQTEYDPRHKDRFFDYNYIGRFNFNYEPVTGNQNGQVRHIDDAEVFTTYQPGYLQGENVVVPNPILVAYNEYATPGQLFTYTARNGLLGEVSNNIWSGMHANVGRLYNRFEKEQDDFLTISASTSFDVKLGKTGTHNIQFGILNEQRTIRDYVLLPNRLWNIMNQSANAHFNGLDTSKVIGRYFDPFWSPIIGDSIRRYAPLLADLGDNSFYKRVREKNNIPLDRYVNVNSMNPSEFGLDMFSPFELTTFNILSYRGYDHTGQLQKGNVTFNDFFTSTDANGVRNFPVAAMRPLYQAAFIKDKFTFNKMIFSLGLRVERFDLNTKVLRDPYSLYEVMGAEQFHGTVRGVGAKPANVGNDYKVYVNSQSDLRVRAYRNGDTWYFPDGRQANDGSVVIGGRPAVPYLQDTIVGDNITDKRFNPNTAFADYTPQVNWLPRLAFSFPISENANFFAHYDVLVQRPQERWEVTPLDYLYFYVPGRTPDNNANLLPERVVDYEVGFQQALNKFSALKFSAYYREMRDMIQERTLAFIPVIGRYTTFGNIDFGTVKGFTVQYDLRRTRNAELRIAYTLQFADGTGSDATSQRGLNTRGNVRTLYPLSFDERHNINAIFDYRFTSGKQYNGPRIGNIDVLSNFGVNVQTLAVSGRPYTARLRPVPFGGEGQSSAINGNRLPWRFNIDMRVDKSFNLAAADKKPLNVNVYFRVSNLLDRRNIVRVYSNSGSPTDDGYLASLEGQSVLRGVGQQGRSSAAFLSSYSWAMLNPDFFTLPRRMYVGALLEF